MFNNILHWNSSKECTRAWALSPTSVTWCCDLASLSSRSKDCLILPRLSLPHVLYFIYSTIIDAMCALLLSIYLISIMGPSLHYNKCLVFCHPCTFASHCIDSYYHNLVVYFLWEFIVFFSTIIVVWAVPKDSLLLSLSHPHQQRTCPYILMGITNFNWTSGVALMVWNYLIR